MAANVEHAVLGVTVDAAFFGAPHPGRSMAASSAAPAAAPIFNKSRRESPLEGMESGLSSHWMPSIDEAAIHDVSRLGLSEISKLLRRNFSEATL
jgi:hypothetical protein